MTHYDPPSTPDGPPQRFAAAAIALGAVLAVAVVAHHPALHRAVGGPAAETAAALQALAPANRLVHGGLMAVLGLQMVGFAYFSARLGFRRPAVLAGLVAFAAAAVVMIIPMTLDGFVVADFSVRCAAAAQACGAAETAILGLLGIVIQDLTKVGLAATSVAVLCWSIALLGGKAWAARAVGGLGLVCGLGPLAVLLASRLVLTPHSLAAILLASSLWGLAVAALMVRPSASDPG
jgi:hypothetical protein